MSTLVLPRLELPLVNEGPLRREAQPGRSIPLADFFHRINTITLKLTRGCNLSCAYCNVEAITPKTPRMSIDQFKQVARLLVENSQQSHVTLEFHGGEPLLLPDEWYEEAVAYARGLARANRKQISFPILTNATMLTEERLLRLLKLGLCFSISIDGPPDLNDKVRGGSGAILRTLDAFRRHRVPFGVLSVMSRANYQHMGRVMDWFREVGIGQFRINFLEPQGRGNDDELILTGNEMFEGMCGVLEHMVQNRAAVQEAEVLQMVHRFLFGRAKNPAPSCWEFECQAGRTYLTVDQDGVLHACGTDLKNHQLGRLDRDMDLDHYEGTLKRLHHKSDWVLRCFDCSARQICRHSCPTSDHNSPGYREYECDFTKRFYRYLGANPRKVQTLAAALMGSQGPPPGAAFVSADSVQLVSHP